MDEKVACKPLEGAVGIGVATVNYTICNNASVPRTYTWTATPLAAAPPCTQTLAATDITPASGTTITVPPGGCFTFPLTVRCREFKAGDCARFQVCATSGPDAHPICCESVVYRPGPATPILVPGPEASKVIPTLAVGVPTTLTFELANPETRAIEAHVTLRDSFDILAFSADGSTRGQHVYSTSTVLPARSTQTLRVQAVRLDQGNNPPPFSSVLAWARTEKLPVSAVFATEPDLESPVRLSPGTVVKPNAPPAIQSFRIEAGQPPRAVLRIASEAGGRYRVERSPMIDGSWATAPGSVLETPVDAQGTFVGTGDHVTCLVPCDHPETTMFFRVVRVD